MSRNVTVSEAFLFVFCLPTYYFQRKCVCLCVRQIEFNRIDASTSSAT